MKFLEPFKRMYSLSLNDLRFHKNGDARGDMFFAVSASLAVHLGAFLILTTATAMSTGLILSEDSILRVSLVSATAVKESNIPVIANSKGSKTEPSENKNRVFEYAALAPALEKVDNTETTKESSEVAVISLARPMGAEDRGVSTAALAESPQKGDSMSNISSTGEITIAIPRYRENAYPNYPLFARMMGYEGVVLISAEIFSDGKVGSLKLKRSSGYSVLDKSAIDAVKTWRFDPAKKMGKPITMWVDVPIKFVLKENEANI